VYNNSQCNAKSGEALASQPTISRLGNSPSKIEAAQLALVMVDQFCATAKVEMFDIDYTFVAAHRSQQLAFWNAHHDHSRHTSLRSRRSVMMRIWSPRQIDVSRSLLTWLTSSQNFRQMLPRNAWRFDRV
jgi:hypothetical protein